MQNQRPPVQLFARQQYSTDARFGKGDAARSAKKRPFSQKMIQNLIYLVIHGGGYFITLLISTKNTRPHFTWVAGYFY